MINNLLSIRGNDQPNTSSSPPCQKHDGEILKLFCQDCDQLICRDCALIDHRNHNYKFIKDVIATVKDKMSEIVKISRANIRALESSLEKIKEQEDSMHRNSVEVNRKLDSFIDNQIKLLEQKRQGVKNDLQKSVTAQKEILDAQMESFQTSLGCLKSSVEFTEETLSKGSDVDILSAKDKMIQQLSELNSEALDLTPRGKIYYRLEVDSPLDDDAVVQKIAKIREYDEQYQVKKCMSGRLNESVELIRPKNSNTFDSANKVQVRVREVMRNKVQVPDISKKPDGSFCCRFHCDQHAKCTIEVTVNGRYVHGSPFDLKDTPNKRLGFFENANLVKRFRQSPDFQKF